MSPAHIAMVSIPAHGHVNPSLEVIRALVRRGHRVTYANDPSFAARVTSTGAELVPYASKLPREGVAEEQWPDDLASQLDLFLDDAIAMLPVLRAAYERDRPDLFLYDIGGVVARILAENWGLPALQLSPTYVAWDGYEQDMAAMVDALKADPRGAAYLRRYSAFLAASGVRETDSSVFVGRPARSLALITRALQPNAEKVDLARYTFVGPCFGDRSHEGRWSRPVEAAKVVLVSLGSAFTNQPAFYRACLEAFGAQPGWHLVLQIGKHVDPAELGELPANVEVHTWVPQLSVLEQADLFVTHAGMGSTHEGLFCGVPMVAVPQAADQFSNADRIVALGVGCRLDTDAADAAAVRAAALALVDDPGVRARLATLQREMRDEGGTARAVEIIEAMLPNTKRIA